MCGSKKRDDSARERTKCQKKKKKREAENKTILKFVSAIVAAEA